jgi:hypothetical protein
VFIVRAKAPKSEIIIFQGVSVRTPFDEIHLRIVRIIPCDLFLHNLCGFAQPLPYTTHHIENGDFRLTKQAKQTVKRTNCSFSIAGHQLKLLEAEAARHGTTKGCIARDYALRLINMTEQDKHIGGNAYEIPMGELTALEHRIALELVALRNVLAPGA